MKINFKSPAIYSAIALIIVIILFVMDNGLGAVLAAGIFGLILCIWSLIYGIKNRKVLYIILGIFLSIPAIFVIYAFIDILFLGGTLKM
jgi:hypothetical protein